ncbi:hypothetical protein J0J29_23365, partial [Vibrio vulnificus]|uniref:hypothetical protein n=1 Tax=Vibrio vulnificus TaxID=672 RepID=UPI0019D46779
YIFLLSYGSLPSTLLLSQAYVRATVPSPCQPVVGVEVLLVVTSSYGVLAAAVYLSGPALMEFS